MALRQLNVVLNIAEYKSLLQSRLPHIFENMVEKPLGPEVPVDVESNEDSFIKVPEGDIFYKYAADDSPDKFDFLRAKYIFRFPFTLSAMKWGAALGSFFALHAYIKKRSVSNSLYWFAWGSVMTGMPIWAFFMLKYTFYSTSIKKFEREQIDQTQETYLAKDYYTKKMKLRTDLSDQEILKQLQKKQQQLYSKYSELDNIEEDPDLFSEFMNKESQEQ